MVAFGDSEQLPAAGALEKEKRTGILEISNVLVFVSDLVLVLQPSNIHFAFFKIFFVILSLLCE